jgi:uridine phosphorylase
MADVSDAPILEFDPDRAAVVEPHRVVEAGADRAERAVLCFFSQVIDRLRTEGAPVLFQLEAAHGVHPVYGYETGGERIAVFHPGVGAALAGGFFEESMAHGCRRFMAVGTAGGLVPDLTIGHVIVPTFAIRDEGTSYHYLAPSRSVEPTPEALDALVATLRRHDVAHVTGGTWSTDGFYRETKGKVQRRVAEGCLAVEMEAAALFAIARFRSVPIAQLLTTSDDLSGEDWSGFTLNGDPADDFRWSLFLLAAEAVRAL